MSVLNNNNSFVLKMSNNNSENPEFPLILKKTQLRRTCSLRNGKFSLENRVMNKRGRIHINLKKIPDKSIRYVRDLWNTLVNARWRWILFFVGIVNILAYILIAIFFLFDAWISGDFDKTLENHKTCIIGVNKFTSFFMLGIETITTTGYGYFYPTEYCQLVFAILTISTIITIFIDGAFISVVYVKLGRPTTAGSIFAKRAVVSLRNGKLCLIMRINDKNGKHWIESKVNLYLVKDFVSYEGEHIPNHIEELKVEPCRMLFVPLHVVHEITSTSPLWNTSASDLISSRFEIIAVVSGSSIHTGQPSKSQTSYLGKEILWGYRYNTCMEYHQNRLEFVVSRKRFNQTTAFEAPLCSAHLLSNFQNELLNDGTNRETSGYIGSDLT